MESVVPARGTCVCICVCLSCIARSLVSVTCVVHTRSSSGSRVRERQERLRALSCCLMMMTMVAVPLVLFGAHAKVSRECQEQPVFSTTMRQLDDNCRIFISLLEYLGGKVVEIYATALQQAQICQLYQIQFISWRVDLFCLDIFQDKVKNYSLLGTQKRGFVQ